MRTTLALLDGTQLDLRVLVCETARERSRGLLDHAELACDEAMWFSPAYAIHTFGMRFAIDVVFCDRRGEIVRVAERVPARRLLVCARGYACLELAAGRAGELGFGPGMRLELVGSGQREDRVRARA